MKQEFYAFLKEHESKVKGIIKEESVAEKKLKIFDFSEEFLEKFKEFSKEFMDLYGNSLFKGSLKLSDFDKEINNFNSVTLDDLKASKFYNVLLSASKAMLKYDAQLIAKINSLSISSYQESLINAPMVINICAKENQAFLEIMLNENVIKLFVSDLKKISTEDYYLLSVLARVIKSEEFEKRVKSAIEKIEGAQKIETLLENEVRELFMTNGLMEKDYVVKLFNNIEILKSSKIVKDDLSRLMLFKFKLVAEDVINNSTKTMLDTHLSKLCNKFLHYSLIIDLVKARGVFEINNWEYFRINQSSIKSELNYLLNMIADKLIPLGPSFTAEKFDDLEFKEFLVEYAKIISAEFETEKNNEYSSIKEDNNLFNLHLIRRIDFALKLTKKFKLEDLTVSNLPIFYNKVLKESNHEGIELKNMIFTSKENENNYKDYLINSYSSLKIILYSYKKIRDLMDSLSGLENYSAENEEAIRLMSNFSFTYMDYFELKRILEDINNFNYLILEEPDLFRIKNPVNITLIIYSNYTAERVNDAIDLKISYDGKKITYEFLKPTHTETIRLLSGSSNEVKIINLFFILFYKSFRVSQTIFIKDYQPLNNFKNLNRLMNGLVYHFKKEDVYYFIKENKFNPKTAKLLQTVTEALKELDKYLRINLKEPETLTAEKIIEEDSITDEKTFETLSLSLSYGTKQNFYVLNKGIKTVLKLKNQNAFSENDALTFNLLRIFFWPQLRDQYEELFSKVEDYKKEIENQVNEHVEGEFDNVLTQAVINTIKDLLPKPIPKAKINAKPEIKPMSPPVKVAAVEPDKYVQDRYHQLFDFMDKMKLNYPKNGQLLKYFKKQTSFLIAHINKKSYSLGNLSSLYNELLEYYPSYKKDEILHNKLALLMEKIISEIKILFPYVNIKK